MTKYPTFPLNPRDFLADPKVQRMTDAEIGFYLKMLCHEWMEGGIPLSSAPVKAWWSKGGTVAECFFERDGRLFNPRLEKEREKKRKWSEKSSMGGKVGAEIKRINVQLKGGTTGGVPPLKAKGHKREAKLLYRGDYKKTSEVFAEVIAIWNDLAVRAHLCPISDIVIGSTRAKNLIYLLSMDGFDFRVLIKKIEAQPFLTGQSKVGWKLSFDWAIKIDNYMKILEGQYIESSRPEEDSQGPVAKSWDQFTDEKKKDGNPFDF